MLTFLYSRLTRKSVTWMLPKPICWQQMILITQLVICTTLLATRNSRRGQLKSKSWLSNKLKSSAGTHLTWPRYRNQSLCKTVLFKIIFEMYALWIRSGHKVNSLWFRSVVWFWIATLRTTLLRLNRLHSALLIWCLELKPAQIKCFR